jgi:hypothetical protein
MYFEDLSLCRYHSGPLDADSWRVPLRAVGWLEAGHAFIRGAKEFDDDHSDIDYRMNVSLPFLTRALR